MLIRRLQDYIQESGRLGRDGCQSEVIVVCKKINVKSKTEVEDEKGQSWEKVVKEYVEGKS
jgi:superfamily II DNA helicase RecQ